MRRLLIVFAAIAFCSAPTWADSIVLDVNAWATFTAMANPSLTETISTSFLYDTPTSPNSSGTIVLGSLSMSSSGFLGTFSPDINSYPGEEGGTINGFAPFNNSAGDQIILDWGCCQSASITPGVNTVGGVGTGFFIMDCLSQNCESDEGFGWVNSDEDAEGPSGMIATSKGSNVTVQAVPDGDSAYLMAALSLCAIALVWRWRRIDAI
jgi:hypothetical protein